MDNQKHQQQQPQSKLQQFIMWQQHQLQQQQSGKFCYAAEQHYQHQQQQQQYQHQQLLLRSTSLDNIANLSGDQQQQAQNQHRHHEEEHELCELYEAAAIAAKRIMLGNNNRQRKQLPISQYFSNNNTRNDNNNNNTCKTITTNRPILSAVKQIPILATRARGKNDGAINDLLSSIPEIDRNFDVHSRIGHGTFSTVLLATLKKERNLPDSQRRKFAIKHHIPTSHPDRIMKELQCMLKIGGKDNVIGIDCCIRSEASIAFVMPYMSHDRFHDFFTTMQPAEVKIYMKNLLIALRHVHKFALIHRDVKPSNFLYNRRLGKFLLVDFGLAQYLPDRLIAPYHQIAYDYILNLHLESEKEEQRVPKRATQKRARDFEDIPNLAGSNNSKRLRKNNDYTNATTVSSASVAANVNKMPLKQINEITLNSVNVPPDCSDISNLQSQMQEGGSVATPVGAHTLLEGSSATTATSASTPVAGGSNLKYSINRAGCSTNVNNKCYCYGYPNICKLCLVKKDLHASRAGTPGYRPPEVLLKYPDQTTAVDVWAAGVIFLSILSSVYPFFKAPNDYVALSEMVTVFGDKKIRKTAVQLDRMLTLSQRGQPLDLRKVCVRFRNRIFSSAEVFKKYAKLDGICIVCKNCDQYYFNCLCQCCMYKTTEPIDPHDIFPLSAYDLLERLLEVNPHKRITAEEALKHPFLADVPDNVNAQKTDNNSNAQNNSSCYNGISKTVTETKSATVVPLKRIGPLLDEHLNLQLGRKS